MNDAAFYCPNCYRRAMHIYGDWYLNERYFVEWDSGVFYCPKCEKSWDMGEDYSERINIETVTHLSIMKNFQWAHKEYQLWLNRHHMREYPPQPLR